MINYQSKQVGLRINLANWFEETDLNFYQGYSRRYHIFSLKIVLLKLQQKRLQLMLIQKLKEMSGKNI